MGEASLVGGLGLTGLGPWYYGIAQPAQARADERHDRVDVVTRGMLGVTVVCARCHDHKYDPFSQKDYYALAGVFASSRYREYPLVSEVEVSRWKAKKSELDLATKAVDKFLEQQGELGIDHTKLTYNYSGRDFRLTDVAGSVVREILA